MTQIASSLRLQARGGKLSADDATVVKKTLDDVDAQPSSTTGGTDPGFPAHTSAQGASAPAGSGGGPAKTELSETVLIAGWTKITTITYTDNSTATTTTIASATDKLRYGKPSASDAAADPAKIYCRQLIQAR